MAVFKDKIIFVPKEAYTKILPKEGIVVGRAKTPVPAIPTGLRVEGSALQDLYSQTKLPPEGTYAIVLDEQKLRKRYLTCQVIPRQFENAFEGTAFAKTVFTVDTTQIVVPEQDVSILKQDLSTLRQKLCRDMLEKFLEEIYPGEWDVTETTTLFHVIIHWPEIEIKNKNASHIIRDLYVKFDLNKSTLSMPNNSYLCGIRGTLTEQEFVAGYAQSHLDSHNNTNWASFCLGSGTMPDLLLKMRAATKPSETLLFGFLLQLDDYVRWESLEGVPYISFESIKGSYENFKETLANGDIHALIGPQAKGAAWHKAYAGALFNILLDPNHSIEKPKDPLFISKAGISMRVVLNTHSREVVSYLRRVIGSIMEPNALQHFNLTKGFYAVDSIGRAGVRSTLDTWLSTLNAYEATTGPTYKGKRMKFQVVEKNLLMPPKDTETKKDEIILTCGPGVFILLIQHINAWLYEAASISVDNLLWKTPTPKHQSQQLSDILTDIKQNS